MLKKILTLGVTVVMCLVVLCGCSANKYNAVVLRDGYSFRSEFLKDNITRGSHYLDENGEVAVADGESYPDQLVFIIRSQKDCDKIFATFPPNIDFEKEMLIVYIFASSILNPCKINKVVLEANLLKIEYKFEKSKNCGDNTSSPMQRCFTIKMSKLEIEEIEFTRV